HRSLPAAGDRMRSCPSCYPVKEHGLQDFQGVHLKNALAYSWNHVLGDSHFRVTRPRRPRLCVRHHKPDELREARLEENLRMKLAAGTDRHATVGAALCGPPRMRATTTGH